MKFVKLIFRNRATISGTAFILAALFFIGELVGMASEPFPISGKVQHSKASIAYFDAGRFGSNARTARNTLVFSVCHHDQQFIIRKNLGDFHAKNHLETDLYRLSNRLTAADSVTVWISKKERNVEQAQIFRLDVNGKTEIDFYDSQSARIFASLLFAIFGTALFWLGARH